ncbi:MAG: phosphotransferase [Chlorobia bacterium]|nr:phosphotransferase [Fimbriimonadaceae bacterium]
MIYFISGPPGAGKTSLCQALLARVEFGLHIPVDDLRLWVTSGLSESIPWTDETERQFQLAERSACAVARTYAEAGFVVAIDHCRSPKRLESLIQSELPHLEVRKVLLLPNLDVNLDRNHNRTNKDFDPSILDETIRSCNASYRNAIPEGWQVIDNSAIAIGNTIQLLESRPVSP